MNGDAYGGAVEILLNCDLVIASSEAKFASPEVKRGVVPNQGAIPRLAKIAGHQVVSSTFLIMMSLRPFSLLRRCFFLETQ